jgi:hypothetical protein
LTKVIWNKPGERYFETGVDRGVLYTNDSGVAWNGLVSVTESPSGGEATPYYIDGVKYLNLATPEEFSATIEAYTYPDEFAECDGTAFEFAVGFTMQTRKQFHLSYRTKIGNDINGENHGYKIHIIHNALAAPSERANATLGEETEALTFSWEVTTTPIRIEGRRPTSHIIIDSTKTTPVHMEELEHILYGSEETTPRIPTPKELVALFGSEMYQIIESPTTGLTYLKEEIPERDVRGDSEVGLYDPTLQTSLTESSTPGLYTLEP